MTIDPKTLAFIALLVHVLVRLLKAGKLSEVIPSRWRPFVALAIGATAAALDAMVAGTPPQQAIITAALGVATAMAGHDALIEGVLGGKELFE